MPATLVDKKTLSKASQWAKKYFNDPSLGAGKRLPTTQELQAKFGEGITLELIKSQFSGDLFETNIQNQSKEQDDVTKEENIQNKPEPNKTALSSGASKSAGATSFQTQSSGLVKDSLKAANAIYVSSASELTPKLRATLSQSIEQSLPKYLSTKLTQEELKRISEEIAQETSREVLEHIGTLSSKEQIPSLIADSLTQSIIAHPKLEDKVKYSDTKLFEKVASQTQQAAEKHSQELEKAAVLGKINLILQKPAPQTVRLIENAVSDSIELKTPLLHPSERTAIRNETFSFISNYQNAFTQQVAPNLKGNATPTFDSLIKSQNSAYSAASQRSAAVAKYDLNARVGFILGYQSSPEQQEAFGLGQATPTFSTFTRNVPLVGKGVGLAMGSDKARQEASLSLLAHDKVKLNQALVETSQAIENMRGKKTLSYKDRLIYLKAQKNLAMLRAAQAFSSQQTRKHQTYLSYFQLFRPPQGGAGLAWASQSAWLTRNALSNSMPGVYTPQSALSAPYFAQRSFGSLAFQIGNFKLSNLTSFIGKKAQVGPSLGMGMAKFAATKAGPMMIVAPAVGLLNKIAKGASLVGAAALFYFLKLGMAAALGAIVGGTIGAVTGAVAGAYIGAAIGSVVIPIPIVGTLIGGAVGAFIGAQIGGAIGTIAGGMIGYGLASGSTAALGAGIGTAAGAGIGAFLGYGVGYAAGAGLVLACGAIFAPCYALLPIAAPMGGFVGSALGAIAGSVIGGALGWAAGKALGILGSQLSGAALGATIGFYLGGPVGALVGAGIGWLATGGFGVIKGFFGSGGAAAGNVGTASATAVSGLIGGVSGFLAGLTSSLLGAGSSLLGGALGVVSSIGGSLVGGFAGATISGAMITTPIALGVGSIALGSIIVDQVKSVAFSSEEKDNPLQETCTNDFFVCTKTAEPIELNNTQVQTGADIKFIIDFEAKIKLTNISVVDDLVVYKQDGSRFSMEVPDPPINNPGCPNPPPSTINQNETWHCEFTMHIQNGANNFENSLIANTVRFTAKPEDKEQTTDSAVAYVPVGVAPQPPGGGPPNPGGPGCPDRWPFGSGVNSFISQGPDGTTDHDRFGMEALDMPVAVGNEVVSTIEGNVVFKFLGTGGPLDYRIGIEPDPPCQDLTRLWYFHLSTTDVEVGNRVQKGQRIGTSGDYFKADVCIINGINVCGPHIHYQFNNAFTDPLIFKMEIPNIPQNLSSRDCKGLTPAGCGITISIP